MKFRDLIEGKFDNLNTSTALAKLANYKKDDKIGDVQVSVEEAEKLLALYDNLNVRMQNKFDTSTIPELRMWFKTALKEGVVKGDKEEYQKFFNSILKKYGVKSPAELSDEDKKKFYDEVDAGWESDLEESTNEAVSNSTLKAVEDLMDRLESALRPGGMIARNVIKEYGTGYKKDFDTMNESLMDIRTVWDSIVQDTLSESKEDRLYKNLISFLDKNGTDYKVDSSKLSGQPRVKINGYVIGSGTEFHDMYTVYKRGREVKNCKNLDTILDVVSE